MLYSRVLMLKIGGVVFDLFGVLVKGGSRKFYNELNSIGINLQYQDWRLLYRKASAGDISYQVFVDTLASKSSAGSAEIEEKLAEMVSESADAVFGSRDLLLRLKKAGLPLAILTNSIAQWVNLIEGKFRFKNLVRGILVSSAIKARKPSPRAYILAAQMLGLPPTQLVYVGDEDEDIRGARNAGMVTVFIPGEDSLSEHFHYRVSNLQEMLDLPIFK